MTTGSELEEIQSRDGANIDTGKVSCGALDGSVVVTVDNEGSLAEGEATTSHFSFTSSIVFVVTNASEVTSETEVVEALEEGGSFLAVEVVNNKGKLGHIIDFVASGHDERTAGSRSESRGNSVSLLVEINLSVPFSEDLERERHATLTAHVTEGTLSRTVSTRTTNSWDSRHGTTSAPRLSGVFVTSNVVDSMTLSSVFGHVGVAELDEIVSDGGSEHSGHVDGADDFIGIVGVNADGWTGSHSALTKVYNNDYSRNAPI